MKIEQPAGIADYTDPTGSDFRALVLEAPAFTNDARTAEADRIAADVAHALGLGTDTAAI